MSEPVVQSTDLSSPLAYKVILQKVIDSRPSGTRQRLAEALGKNRSFVSQITNPAYATPVPAQHIETIFTICHFSMQEKAEFLEAYRIAHPSRLELVDDLRPVRTLVLELPDFGSPALNRKIDEAVQSIVRAMSDVLLNPDANSSDESDGKQR
jgi:hypothetical protein